MVFNTSNIKQMIIVLIAIVIIGFVLIGKLAHKDVEMPRDPLPVADTNDSSPSMAVPKPAALDDNEEIIKRMTEQMEKDRQQQRRIKDLKMQKEETDLELEEQKALSELNKFKKDSIGPVDEENPANSSNMDIKIVYLGGADTQREAILSINGANYYVKDKDRPLKNMEVGAITNNDVTIHFLTPQDTTTIYQFKSE